MILPRSFKAGVKAGASRGLWEAKSCTGNKMLEDVKEEIILPYRSYSACFHISKLPLSLTCDDKRLL